MPIRTFKIVAACGLWVLFLLVSTSSAEVSPLEGLKSLFAPPPRPIGPGPAAGVAPPRSGPAAALDLHLLVDQFGYRTGDPKVAIVRSPRIGFDSASRFEPSATYEVRSARDDRAVRSATPRPWMQGKTQASSGDAGWWLDFSGLDQTGHFYVYDVSKRVRSATFAVGPDPYAQVLRAALRVFYYQRSGLTKRAPWADPCWTDDAAYAGPGQDGEARDVRRRHDAASARDLGGGWFDAGDTNKYVTFATGPVHDLLTAYQDFPAAFSDDLNIPESGNGIPDVLDEVRWELDWLRKMQDPDGRSLLKVGALKHVWAAPPSSDHSARYYVGPCTSATIAAAGMFAHAALVLDRFPALESEVADLRDRARRGFDAYLRASAPQTDCDDGSVVSGDADRSAVEQSDLAVAASAYLFGLTGDARYERFVRKHYRSTRPYRDQGWSRYDAYIGEAVLAYASTRGADATLAATILGDKFSDAKSGNGVYGTSDEDLYRNLLHPEQYHWGSNSIRVNYAISNLAMITHGIDPAGHVAYRGRALETLHYLHGVNPFGIVYLSNMYRYGASYSSNEMFHTWFAPETRWSNALTSECGPAPGFLVGGPNPNAAKDGVPHDLVPPVGQPPQKSFRDWNQGWPENSYAITEPSTGFQGSYVRLLAAFVE